MLEISERRKESWNQKSPHQSPCKHLHEWAWSTRWPISPAARRCAVFELRLSAWRMTRVLTLVLGLKWKLEVHVTWCDMVKLASCRNPPWSRSLTNIPCPDTCLAMENRVSLPSLRFATLPIMLVRIPCCLTVRLLDQNSWKVTIPAIQVTKQHHVESKSGGPKSSLSFSLL